jgi:hypothetical protein
MNFWLLSDIFSLGKTLNNSLERRALYSLECSALVFLFIRLFTKISVMSTVEHYFFCYFFLIIKT